MRLCHAAGWGADHKVRKDEVNRVPVNVEARRVIVRFLEYLSAHRLSEAGRLTQDDTWYETPGLEPLSGLAGLESFAAYLDAALSDEWEIGEPVYRTLGHDVVEMRMVTGHPGRRLRWTAVISLTPEGGRIRSLRIAAAGTAETFDRAPCGVQKCRLDEACSCIYLSDGFLRMVGFTRDEIRDLFENSFYRLLVPEDVDRVQRTIEKQLSAGESTLELEYRLRAKDGRDLWVLDKAEIFEEDGQKYAACVISDITPLHDLRTYYETILDCLPTPLVITDAGMRLKLVNQSALQLIGKSAEDLLGHPCSACDLPICTSAYCCAERLKRGEKTSYLEKDNRTYKVDASYLCDANGSVAGHIAVMSDISALREMDASLKSLADNIPGGVCEVAFDDDFTLLYGNEGFFSMYGYTPEEMRTELGNRLTPSIHPDDVPRIRKTVSEALEKNSGFEYEKRVYRRDGTMACMLTRGTFSKRPGGYVLNCVIIDITARKNIEQELMLSEERFRIALAQTTDIVFEYDMGQHLVRHTNRSVAVYGLEQVVENAPWSIVKRGVVTADFVESFLDMYRRIDGGEQTVSCEVQAKLADGTLVWDRLTMTNVYGSDGRPFRAIGIIEDITAQKEAERRFADEEQFRTAMLSKAITSYEVNVTQNRMIRGHDGWDSRFHVELTDDFEELMRRFAEKAVHPEEREAFLEMHSCRYLLDAFEQGAREFEAEYRRRETDVETIWVSCTLHLLQEPESGDVKGFAYVTNIDGQKKHELSLQYNAERDLLTGLYNRHTTEQLIRDLLKTETVDTIHAFMMIDLDNFKSVNDTLGHIFGDAVLSEIAKKIRGVFRKSDIVGRIGGDEFVVFLRDIPQTGHAVAKAEELCQEFRTSFAGENGTYKISGSVGVSYYPADGTTFDELYGKADMALYAAKHRGKDACAVYRETLADRSCRPRPLDAIESTRAKDFSDNVSEYVFRILYEAKDLRLAVESVLKLLCRHFGVSRGYIFENTLDDTACSNTFEWCDAGVEPQIGGLQNITYASLGGYEHNFAGDDIYIVHSLDDVPQEERDILEPQGIQSMLQCAIRVGGKFKGFMGVDDCKRHRTYTADEIETLKNAAGLLGTFLSGWRSQEALRQTNRALKTVMDNLNSYAYVVHPDTYELLFINHKTLEVAPAARVGETCYKAFWNSDQPCAVCPMRELTDEKPSCKREIYNHMLDIWTETTASYVDWTDDERCCLLNCMDISQYKKTPAKD